MKDNNYTHSHFDCELHILFYLNEYIKNTTGAK